MANTLYEYYTSKGQALPTVQDRAKIFSQYGGVGNYTGSTQQNNFLLGKLQSAPTVVQPDQVRNVGNITTPTPSPYQGTVSDVKAMVAGTTSQIDTQQQIYQAQLAELDKQRQLIAKQQEENKGFLQTLVAGRKSPAELTKEGFQSLGIDPSQYFAEQKAKSAEINTLVAEFENTKSAMEAEKMQLVDAMASTGYISKAQAAVERKYAPTLNRMSANINAKAAALEALQGNFNETNKFVNQMVEAITAEEKYRYDTMLDFYQLNLQELSRLDTQYQNAYQDAIQSARQEYEDKKAEATEVGNLMMQFNGLGAGINPEDSLVEAQQKVANVGGDLAYYRQQQSLQQQYSGAGGGGTTLSYLDPIMQAAIDAGADSNLAALKAIEYAEGQGIQLGREERNSLTERAKQLKATPLSTPPPMKPRQPVTAYTAGQSVGKTVKPVYEAFKPENLWQGTKDVVGSVGSFFSGLFGL